MTLSVVLPLRIQRKRTKGWRMSPNAVYVGRPSPWGNPITPNEIEPTWEAVVDAYRGFARMLHHAHPEWLEDLRGKDLVCWCPVTRPCHADVLIELANMEVAE